MLTNYTIQNSAPLEQMDTFLSSIYPTIKTGWLKTNYNWIVLITEAAMIGTKSKLDSVNTKSFQLSNTSIPLSYKVKNLDVIIAMKQQIASILCNCHLQLQRKSSIINLFTTDATAELVTSTILSRVDHRSPRWSHLPQYLNCNTYKTLPQVWS